MHKPTIPSCIQTIELFTLVPKSFYIWKEMAYLGSQILKPRITTPGILAFHGSGDFGQHLSHKVHLPVMSCTVDRTKPRLKKRAINMQRNGIHRILLRKLLVFIVENPNLVTFLLVILQFTWPSKASSMFT